MNTCVTAVTIATTIQSTGLARSLSVLNMPEAPLSEQPVPDKKAAEKKGGEEAVKEFKAHNGPPVGVVPLFFSGPSQQIFECVVDEDLTPERPHKLIPKEKIVDDFKNRAAVCDFHPVKQKMLVSAVKHRKWPMYERFFLYS